MKLKSAKIIDTEEKSIQEIETKLVEEHQGKVEEGSEVVEKVEEDSKTEPSIIEDNKVELSDDVVLKYMGSKLGKELSSFDDVIEYREKEVSLPEEVQDYLKFKNDTKRGLKDYVELNKDYDSIGDEEIIKSYYYDNANGLDKEDIDFEYNKKFNLDEFADEDDVRAKNIEIKREATKAREFYNSRKEKYSGKLESSSNAIPEEDLEGYEAYKQYKANSTTKVEDEANRSEYFVNKTKDLFSKFEGFKFKVGDNDIVYKPTDLTKFTPENTGFDSFVSEHVDSNGYLKDPETYHRAMAIAKDPDAYAKYFFDQGVSSQVKNLEKSGKNIDMDIRESGGEMKKGGPKARVVNPDGGNKLRIKQ
jgi:hypothetical protein